MELKAGWGTQPLYFGMSRSKVESLFGKPDTQFVDEEDNAVWVYRSKHLRLSFYIDEDFRLAHIASNHPELHVSETRLFEIDLEEAKAIIAPKGKWETEAYDSTVLHSNEATWVTLVEDMGRLQRVEWGAWLSETTDDFIWREK